MYSLLLAIDTNTEGKLWMQMLMVIFQGVITAIILGGIPWATRVMTKLATIETSLAATQHSVLDHDREISDFVKQLAAVEIDLAKIITRHEYE